MSVCIDDRLVCRWNLHTRRSSLVFNCSV